MKVGDKVRICSKYPATNGKIGIIKSLPEEDCWNRPMIVQLSPSEFVTTYPDCLRVMKGEENDLSIS